MGWVLKNPPVTVDNIAGLKRMAAPDISAAKHDFGFAPVTFDEGLRMTFSTIEKVTSDAAAPATSQTQA